MLGKIYVITNNINNKKYVGQTRRTLEQRFHEHCTKETQSGIHTAIKKYGKENFSISLLEDNIPIENLNKKEAYWIKELNTYNNGYNQTLGGDQVGYNYKHIIIVEKGYIIDSCYHLAYLLEQCNIWQHSFAAEKIKKSLNVDKGFFGYTIQYIDNDYPNLTEDNIVVSWIKELPIDYQNNLIHCKELNYTANSIGEMAEYLINHNYYLGNSKNAKQTITVLIRKIISKEIVNSPIL